METYEIIKKLRTDLGLSQDELAHKVGYTDRSSIAKVEAGKVDLTESKIKMFARALGVSPAELMGYAEAIQKSKPDVNNIELDENKRILLEIIPKLPDATVRLLQAVVDQVVSAKDL